MPSHNGRSADGEATSSTSGAERKLFRGVTALTVEVTPATVAPDMFCAAMGVFLVAGLWTPLVGTLGAIGAASYGYFNPADAGFYVLLAALCVALALLGPGAWSIDARLFGWRRVEIRNDDPDRDWRGPRP